MNEGSTIMPGETAEEVKVQLLLLADTFFSTSFDKKFSTSFDKVLRQTFVIMVFHRYAFIYYRSLCECVALDPEL
jgi:predicted nicotinamide N-methyase